MSKENLYNIMGVSNNASQDELKKAFRKLSMKYHPDRNRGNSEATKKYQEISAAYDILGDEEKRKIYDITGDTNVDAHANGNMFSGGIPVNPEEIFNIFTGGGLGGLGGLFGNSGGGVFHMNINGQPMHFHQQIRKPRPIQKIITISLTEAYLGITKRVEVERTKISDHSREQEKETLYVAISPGIDSNEIITIKDKGDVINGNNHGDVNIIIKINNTTEFVREGIDLIYNKTISLKDSLCGFQFDMKYIDDRIFKINNNNGNVIEPGHKKIIREMGMNREGHKGNLIIIFKIKFPQKLSENKINKISEILE